jgi:ABC-type oligopeptide transport system substrate-binding subunit
MIMRKLVVTLSAVLVLAAFTFAGCSSSEKKSTTTKTTTQKTTTTPATK